MKFSAKKEWPHLKRLTEEEIEVSLLGCSITTFAKKNYKTLSR
jgi:hypothetical protein